MYQFSTLILQALCTCNLGLTEALRALSAPQEKSH